MTLTAPSFAIDQINHYRVSEFHWGTGDTTTRVIHARTPIEAAKQFRGPSDPVLAVTYHDNQDGTVRITVSTTYGARIPDSYTYLLKIEPMV
jgi:hypothetical protein